MKSGEAPAQSVSNQTGQERKYQNQEPPCFPGLIAAAKEGLFLFFFLRFWFVDCLLPLLLPLVSPCHRNHICLNMAPGRYWLDLCKVVPLGDKTVFAQTQWSGSMRRVVAKALRAAREGISPGLLDRVAGMWAQVTGSIASGADSFTGVNSQ